MRNHSNPRVLFAMLFVFLTGPSLLAQSPTNSLSASNQIQAIHVYQDKVSSLLASVPSGSNAPVLIDYLHACQINADNLLELSTAPKELRTVVVQKTRDSLSQRLKKRDMLADNPAWKDPIVKEESDAYRTLDAETHVLDDLYLQKIVVRKTLLDLKYFEEDDPKSANFLEGFINSKVPLLRYEEGAQAWYRQNGVSAFEATVRAEPIVLFNSDHDPAVLMAGGLLYNFFPAVTADPKNSFKAVEDQTLFSKYVRRIGPRFGLGAKMGDGVDFVLGGGVQVRAFTVWGVYEPKGSEFTWAVGISDWKWVKKVLPYFGGN
jgi:hypothetical protein